MTTRTPGSSSWMRWTAATPSMTGISTSMRTTSGRSSRESSRAWRPFSAWPTTSKSGCPSMRVASAVRKRGWSSASKIRVGLCVVITNVPRWRWGGAGRMGHAGDDPRPAARGGVDGERAADQGHPLAHRVEAEAVVAARQGARIEAAAVILDDEDDALLVAGDPHDGHAGGGVLADVGEGLLDHADDLDLGTRGQAEAVGEVGLEVAGEA